MQRGSLRERSKLPAPARQKVFGYTRSGRYSPSGLAPALGSVPSGSGKKHRPGSWRVGVACAARSDPR
jgi:hypothetical protein